MSDKRQQLLDAAIRLFAERGFWNTPTSKIAKEAGVATGTLFNYFDTKDALIDGVYYHLKSLWSAHITVNFPVASDLKTMLEHVWFRYVDWGIQQPIYHRLLEQLRLSDLVSSEARTQVEQEMLAYSLRPLVAQSDLFGDLSLDYLEMLLEAEVDVAIRYALQNELKDMSLAKHMAQSFHIFWSGITA